MISEVAQPKNLKLASQADRCSAEIMNQVRNGTLRPSQKLGEESVAKKMKMGRAPVRIAFERLVSAGVLRRVHRAGTFVREVGLEEYCELLDIRTVLEGLAAHLAAERITPSELARLEKMAQEMDEMLPQLAASPSPDWGKIVQMEASFHAEIARLSGNRVLPRILAVQDLVRCCFHMGLSLNMPATQGEHIPQHRAVVRALASGDPDRAERTLRDHILLSKEQEILWLAGVRVKPAGKPLSAASPP
jgi:DNA-binding GntR family transcriptional regulator